MYVISLAMMTPFLSMGGTSYHMTSTEVEEVDMIVTFDGGLSGATNNPYHYKSNFKN